MLLANFDRKEHLQHRAVSLRQHGFLVIFIIVFHFKNVHWKFHQELQAALLKPHKLLIGLHLGRVSTWSLELWQTECSSLSSSSYSAPTALGINQEVERIRDNVFLFNVLTVFFYIFLERLFTSMMRNAALSYYWISLLAEHFFADRHTCLRTQ